MNKNIKLVLSGSGCLYPVHVGAVIRLAEEGYTFEEVCGTSGGAIVAAAIASGYAPGPELIHLIKSTLPSENKLIDYSLISLVMNWGLIKGEKIEQIFNKLLVNKMGKTIIPLHIVTTDLENEESYRVFSTKNDPNMSVALAIRASMAIPGVFTPMRIEGALHVDGGVTANYFLDLFGEGENVIGLRFKPKKGKSKKGKSKIKSAIDYIMKIINVMILANTNEHMDDATKARTIQLSSDHDGLDFNMTSSDVDDMIKEGYDSVDTWLKKRRANNQ